MLYRRLEDGDWLLRDIASGEVRLESVDATLAFDELYAKTESLPLD